MTLKLSWDKVNRKVRNLSSKITEIQIKLSCKLLCSIKFNSENNFNVERNLYNSNYLEFKDETWERVANRWEDRKKVFLGKSISSQDNFCKNRKASFEMNNILFESKNVIDNWIYIYDKREISDFLLSFNAIFLSDFREIQFGFRHVDFYNRYRFRIETGRIHFDIHYKGKFYNSIFSREFRVVLGQTYKIELVVYQTQYSIAINDRVVLAIKEELPLLKAGTYALILWDPIGNVEIKANYLDIKLLGRKKFN